MTDLKKQVGQLIKQARKDKGLTQRELGEMLGVTAITIRRYEMGGQNLTLETIEKVAASLSIDVAMILR